MQKMGLAATGIYAIGLIGVCSALPIQSVNTGDRNVVLLGAVMFLSFGAVIAGCVCCRRRKKGFEEFRNESGGTEANKTEYPIFRALSPDSQRHDPIVTPPVSNSNENLIDDDFDNNNGPISPADLENIENNNAVDYIQNQNEVGIVIEPPIYSANRNIVNTEALEFVQQHSNQAQLTPLPAPIVLPQIQDITVTSTNPCLDVERPIIHSAPSDAKALEVVVVVNPLGNTAMEHEVEEEPFIKETQTVSLQMRPIVLNSDIQIQINDIDSVNVVEDVKDEDIILSGDAESLPTYEDVSTEVGNIQDGERYSEEKDDKATADEVISVKSNSSERSGEINSVEEALRALDCAIAGEISIHSGGDDDDLIDEDLDCDDVNFQNVIRQLLINNGVKSVLSDSTSDEANDNFDKTTTLNGIRTEAEILVDSILNESRKIIEEKYTICNDQTITLQNVKTQYNTDFACLDEVENRNKSEVFGNSPTILTPAESIEDFLSFKPLEKTSTPCIEKKFLSQRFFPSEIQGNELRKKLLEGEETATSPLDKNVTSPILNETVTITEQKPGVDMANGTFVCQQIENNECNGTFNVNRTFDVQNMAQDDLNREYTHPGDPCTSRQAIERDSCFPSIVYDHEEINSGDMTTVTPVNTPIELNYSNEMWNRITKGVESNSTNTEDQPTITNDDNGFANNGWFLHPQASKYHENETFDVDGDGDEEDETNLESTFEALRKQLAEVLPQPQGITGPAEYSDDEEDVPQNRTFDEYRSPLDPAIVSLLEGDPTPGTTVQNEMFINYKRVLTPILEESEEETCKTFVMNDTKCLDSTSTGCVDTGEAIMGVSKALMASNDTLFNFEDTLGDREDIFSPRTHSRSETQQNLSSKSGKSTEENSIATLDSEKLDSNNSDKGLDADDVTPQGRRSPPKTIDIAFPTGMVTDNDVCSPEQQRTFSEGTNSSNTDRVSSDVSGTVDHDATFTTYTNDERTCITVIVKDDERISEISEPEWGSTASYGGYEMNSLTDVPSLDYNINSKDGMCENDDEKSISSDALSNNPIANAHNTPLKMMIENSYVIEDSQQNDSGNSSRSADDQTTNSDRTLEDETERCDRKLTKSNVAVDNHDAMNQSQLNPSDSSVNETIKSLDDKDMCRDFIRSEIAVSSSQSLQYTMINEVENENQLSDDDDNDDDELEAEEDADLDSSKENKNPNVKKHQHQPQQLQQQLTLSPNSNDFDKQNTKMSYQKVQSNSQDAVIVDKTSKINSEGHPYENMELRNGGLHDNIFYKPETTILPNKHQQIIANYSVNNVSVNGEHNEQHCYMVADEIIAHLSGEEDPWAEPLHNDLHFTGPCSEVITSFTNEWDSDVDDSHSSEEFMYVRGTPTKEKISEILNGQPERENRRNNANEIFEYDGLNEADVWSTHEDKVPIADSAEDEISEESSSEFEGEFVPSCWDSMATPARSALKSPDKSSSEEEKQIQPSKKRRSVAFKKQRYHSVYEYPRETASLSPSYSEPYLCSNDSESLYFGRDSQEEFDDGFTVSSSMRPFHGSQFNALCHTWPTDSDFSWSQIEDLSDMTTDKKLSAYTHSTTGKWPSNFDSIDLMDGDVKAEGIEDDGINRPDSGVGESAEMLSDRMLPLGELCHTKTNLRLPLELLPPTDSLPGLKVELVKMDESSSLADRLILPTPSCTGSMDSISSSSGSERHVSFSTFGKLNQPSHTCSVEAIEAKRPNHNSISNTKNEQLKPALILIENGPIEFPLGSDKIKQSDSTDEDSGIESIMKVNKESD